MSLILGGTALVGLLVSKLLLMAAVTNIVIRYPLAVVVAYLAFFGFIKLWLSYITRSSDSSYDASDVVVDGIASIPDFSVSGVPSPAPTFGGGRGGSFGGGGASGMFDSPGIMAGNTVIQTAADSGSGIGQVAGDAAGDAASGIFEDGGWVLVVLGLLLAVVFGAGIYLVYDAPFILTEAAFDFFLAAGLLKSARKMDHQDWTGSVLRTTGKPFLVVLVIALLAAALIHVQYPDVQKLSEIFRG